MFLFVISINRLVPSCVVFSFMFSLTCASVCCGGGDEVAMRESDLIIGVEIYANSLFIYFGVAFLN